MKRKLVLTVVLLTIGACADSATEDFGRGYTKAPLENPGLLVAGEEVTAMVALGDPIRPAVIRPSDIVAPGAADGAAQEQEVTLAPGVTQEQFDQGRELFSGQGGCQACHGPNAAGTQLGPDLTDDQWLHVPEPSVEAIAGVIRAGVPQPQEHPAPMPPMGGASLNDQQLQALAGYIASISQN